MGGLFGHAISFIVNEPNTWRFVEPCVCLGMCALFGCVFRFPVTAMLVILELVDNEPYFMILPIVFAAATAAWFGSTWLHVSSWVDELLEQEAEINPETESFNEMCIKRFYGDVTDAEIKGTLSPNASVASTISHVHSLSPSRLECELLRDVVQDHPSERSFMSFIPSLPDSPSTQSGVRLQPAFLPGTNYRRPSHCSTSSRGSYGIRTPDHKANFVGVSRVRRLSDASFQSNPIYYVPQMESFLFYHWFGPGKGVGRGGGIGHVSHVINHMERRTRKKAMTVAALSRKRSGEIVNITSNDLIRKNGDEEIQQEKPVSSGSSQMPSSSSMIGCPAKNAAEERKNSTGSVFEAPVCEVFTDLQYASRKEEFEEEYVEDPDATLTSDDS